MKELCTTVGDLRVLREALEAVPRFGLDFETTSEYPYKKAPLHHDKLKTVGFGFGFPSGDKAYVPLMHTTGPNAPLDESMSLLTKVLADSDKEMWAHNAKFELQVAHVMGVPVKNKIRCSMIAQYLLDKGLSGGRGLKLKPAAQKYLKHKMIGWEDIVTVFEVRAHEILPHRMAPYCADDALQALRLGELWIPEMKELGVYKAFTNLECPFTEVLVHMREVGFAINSDHLTKLHKEFKQEEVRLAQEFEKLTGVSVSSNPQVSVRMYDQLRWWPRDGFQRGKSGKISVDKNHRKILFKKVKKGTDAYRALELKQRHSQVAKLNSTYTTSLTQKAEMFLDGRLRCNFNQTRTATGRLSSSDPNFQNIPSRGEGVTIREAFVSEPGWVLCDSDYSQADLVMMAHLSKDPMLLKAYNEGIDLHQQTADACQCDRFTGKTLNLGLIYEMGPGTLAENLGISFDLARLIHSRWHSTYPNVRRFQKYMHRYAEKHGYVRTITGRVRFLKNIHSKNSAKRAYALREASNTPDQGSVSDVIKIAMRNLLWEWRDRGVLYDYWTGEGKAKILSQVHDEIICELREDFAVEGKEDVKRHMEQAVKLRAPMRADPGLGYDWLAAKKDSDEGGVFLPLVG